MRCKVGDLVFIIKGSEHNIGKIGRITKPWINDDEFRGDWVILTQGAPFFLNKESRRGINGIVYDHQILPIRGDKAAPKRERKKPMTT
jgi:hypothetical protein